ncbi:MAG: YihY/virulence factor BrkB family protein [Planctomycetaceae bacterium]
MSDRPRPRLSFSLNGLTARQLAMQTWKRMEGHDAMIWAAAIAFYALFATVPLLALFLVVTVLQLPDLSGAGGRTSGLGHLTVDQLEATLKSLFPREAYVLVHDQIARIQSEPPVGLISVAVAVALWVVTSVSLTLIDALNRTFGVAETRSFAKLRLTGLALTLLQAAVLLGSLVAIAAWPLILQALGLDPSGSVAWVATVVRWIAVFLTVLLSFALTFNVGPAARQRWVWITPGTLAGTVAFLAFSYLFRVYVRYYGSYDRAYGTLGGIMVLLFWYWVVGMVLLGAAEMDRAIEAAAQAGESRGRGTDPSHRDLQSMTPEVRA